MAWSGLCDDATLRSADVRSPSTPWTNNRRISDTSSFQVKLSWCRIHIQDPRPTPGEGP
jgi:hypothetical protein